MRLSHTVLVSAGMALSCVPPGSPAVISSSAQVVVNDSPPGAMESPTGQGVLVLVDKRVPRPTEVVGILDFHSSATDENKGFEELRARAAALGADAVLGAEFEHGGGPEPSHLSGIAVRFLDR